LGHRQKGKGNKRKKSWHRGGVEAKSYWRATSKLKRARVDVEVDYTQATPTPLNSHSRKNQR
jgi:hypothetical protein